MRITILGAAESLRGVAKLGTPYDRQYMPGADLTQWDPLFRDDYAPRSSTS
jgi:hypothetical protein